MNRPVKQHKIPSGWKAVEGWKFAIKRGRLFDPAASLDEVADIVIEKGRIIEIGVIPENWDGAVIDADGWIIFPGLFDMHVHLREPGGEHKETVETGCKAAIAGGFTGVACMPNTDPAIDNVGLVNFVKERALGLPVDVYPVASITLGRNGKSLTEIAELSENGVTAFSDDGSPIDSSALMRRALEYTRMLNAVVIEHCEDSLLTEKGVMHEGAVSTELGLPGWPAIGEEIAVSRNIQLAEYTGGSLHVAHISTAGAVQLVREAKARGINVTAEVTPQHLTIDCGVLETYHTDYKVNPPLRSPEDVEAVVEGLKDGTIDVIASDHAPHSMDEKEVEFINAPFGMTGLETTLSVIMTKLVDTGIITMERAIEALTTAPRTIMNLPEVRIEKGFEANLSFFDPEKEWVVDRTRMMSKSQNTPFHSWNLRGQACGVLNNGVAWIREE